MNQSKVTDLDYINLLVASPLVFTCRAWYHALIARTGTARSVVARFGGMLEKHVATTT